MLRVQLSHLSHLDGQIETLNQEVARRLDPEATVAALDTIPGVGRSTAQVILAEMGADMEQPSGGHLASWAGVCPGNNRSADKRKRSPTRKGNNWLKPVLVEAARAAARTKTYLGAQYHRLARRIGANRAAMAVAQASPSSSTRSSRPGSPSPTWGTGTSKNVTKQPSPAGLFANSNASATK